MSISHIIVIGLFIVLGSLGLAMMQSALSMVWKASGFALRNRSAGNQNANSRMTFAKVEASRPIN